MRITLSIILLTLALPFFAQELYQDKEGTEYLFIGGIADTSLKVWNKSKKVIEWKDAKQLEPTDRLQAPSFLTAVFDEGLSFHAEGDEPFWGAEIKKDSLIFFHPLEGKSSYPLKIDANDFIDSSFSCMFKCEDENIYGLVRGHSYFPRQQQICELCICDEVSLYEIFINFKGYIYKGCVRIEKML